MSTIVLRRSGHALFPVDPVSQEVVAGIPAERDVICEIRVARSAKHHRWLFCLLNLVVNNTDDFEDVEDLLTWLKLSARMVEPMVDHQGHVIYVLKSISFSAMGQEKFSRVVDRFLRLIEARWPHLHRQHMMEATDREFASYGFERKKTEAVD